MCVRLVLWNRWMVIIMRWNIGILYKGINQKYASVVVINVSFVQLIFQIANQIVFLSFFLDMDHTWKRISQNCFCWFNIFAFLKWYQKANKLNKLFSFQKLFEYFFINQCIFKTIQQTHTHTYILHRQGRNARGDSSMAILGQSKKVTPELKWNGVFFS